MLGVVSAVRDLGRLREITKVLVRHGFGEVVTRLFGSKEQPKVDASVVPSDDDVGTGDDEKRRISTAERIRLVIQDLGPSFIKLGQIVSTRSDVLPDDLLTELKRLQDDVPPASFEEIRVVVETSLGAPLDQVFEFFDEKPLAAASIGQVHRARIRVMPAEGGSSPEGDLIDVVVKVQRPGVGATVQRDLEILHFLAAAVERALPELKIYAPRGLVDEFDRSITAELNFAHEAENAQRFAENFAGHPYVRFPKIYRQASSKHVLTQEFFDGRKISKALADGMDGKLVAKRAVGVVIKMTFDHGFFHADPHPGNIILLGPNDDPVLGLIDTGMVGRLSPEMRDRTIDLMIAAARKDGYAVADAIYAIGRPTKKVDMREYRSYVAVLAEKYLGRTLKDIQLSALLRDLVQGALKFGIEVPPDFMLVGKALMTLEGIARELDPELDVFSEAQPHFIELLKKRYSPERLGNELWRGVEHFSKVGYDLPMQAREVLDDLRLGRLTIRHSNDEHKLAIERAGKRLFTGITFLALTGGGAYLLGNRQWIGAGVFLFLAVLAWSRDVVRG